MASQNLIGDRVRKLRETKNLTQDQVAAACQRIGWDVSRVTIAKIESGVRVVNDGEIVVMAAVLKTTAGDLLNPVKVTKAITVVRQGTTAK